MSIIDRMTNRKAKPISAVDHYQNEVAEALAALTAAQSAYRVAAHISYMEPTAENDRAAFEASAAVNKAQVRLDGAEEALARSRTQADQDARAAERQRILAEDEAAKKVIAYNYEAAKNLSDAIAAYVKAFAAARDSEHHVMALFGSNDRLRAREDLKTDFFLPTVAGIEIARLTPEPLSGDVSDLNSAFPPGAVRQGDLADAGDRPRSQWTPLAERVAQRANVMHSLLTAVK